jgi:hypothetical protein
MLRLLGFVVLIFIAVIAFRPITSVFDGTMTPHEAIQQVRTDVSDKIAPHGVEVAQPANVVAPPVDSGDTPQLRSMPDQSEDTTQKMARQLLQQATDQNSR